MFNTTTGVLFLGVPRKSGACGLCTSKLGKKWIKLFIALSEAVQRIETGASNTHGFKKITYYSWDQTSRISHSRKWSRPGLLLCLLSFCTLLLLLLLIPPLYHYHHVLFSIVSDDFHWLSWGMCGELQLSIAGHVPWEMDMILIFGMGIQNTFMLIEKLCRRHRPWRDQLHHCVDRGGCSLGWKQFAKGVMQEVRSNMTSRECNDSLKIRRPM